MNFSRKLFENTLKIIINAQNKKHLSFSTVLKVKEIKEIQEDNRLVIYGEYLSIKSPDLINKTPEKCPVCASGLKIKHTDVLILSQFVRTDGCMLPKRITGLCRKQQRHISDMVAMAQKAGLMSNLTPSYSKKDPKKRYQWKKFNTYFDESTIKWE